MRSLLVVVAVVAAGCMVSPEVVKRQFEKEAPPVVVKQAAFDFDCASDRVQVSNLSSRMFGARGCGKKASYEVSCGVDASSGIVPETCKAKINGTVMDSDAR